MEIIINTYGVSLNKENEGFVVTNVDGKQRIPTDGIRTIKIGKGAQITSDAIMLAIEKEIEVLFINKSGDVVGRVWSPKYGSISTIRKGQLAFATSKSSVEWIKDVITRKIENQQAMLLMMETDDKSLSDKVQSSIQRLEVYVDKISALYGDRVADIAKTLRGWEGMSSKMYFDTLNLFLKDEFRFERRTQHPAMDLINALLNYGYGILYGKIEGYLISAGIDPYIGILHRDEYNRPVLVYDIIELYRVWVDYVVYSLVIKNAITDEFYSVKSDGSYWLEALGRRILIQSMNDYLDEVVLQNGIERSRHQHMFLYIQSFAQKLKNY